jgi:hypothetical protein
MMHKFHLFATSATSGFTLATMSEFLRAVNWQNFLAVVVSAASAGLSWYISVRQAQREQDRLDREEARQQRWEDKLQELALQKAAAEADIPTPPEGKTP